MEKITLELTTKAAIEFVNEIRQKIGEGIDYRFSNDNECRIWHTLLNNSSYEYNIHTNESSKNIKYLHQLQHELFDAGIELKIEL